MIRKKIRHIQFVTLFQKEKVVTFCFNIKIYIYLFVMSYLH